MNWIWILFNVTLKLSTGYHNLRLICHTDSCQILRLCSSNSKGSSSIQINCRPTNTWSKIVQSRQSDNTKYTTRPLATCTNSVVDSLIMAEITIVVLSWRNDTGRMRGTRFPGTCHVYYDTTAFVASYTWTSTTCWWASTCCARA